MTERQANALLDEGFDIDIEIRQNLKSLILKNWDSKILKEKLRSLILQRQQLEQELWDLEHEKM